jgi:hypothetical protein
MGSTVFNPFGCLKKQLAVQAICTKPQYKSSCHVLAAKT